MNSKFKVIGIALAVVALVAFGLVGAAFAASPQASGATANAYGEPGDCTGPGDMHRWGQEAGNGTCLRYTGLCPGPCQMYQYSEQSANGASYGDPSNGTGPGDMHQWGAQDGQGASWGEPSDGTGPGDMHQWGRG